MTTMRRRKRHENGSRLAIAYKAGRQIKQALKKDAAIIIK